MLLPLRFTPSFYSLGCKFLEGRSNLMYQDAHALLEISDYDGLHSLRASEKWMLHIWCNLSSWPTLPQFGPQWIVWVPSNCVTFGKLLNPFETPCSILRNMVNDQVGLYYLCFLPTPSNFVKLYSLHSSV